MAKKQSSAEDTKKDKSLEDAVESIQEKFGEGSIMFLGSVPKKKVDVIPTGSLSLDLALGVGGIPRGRIVEIFGAESSGKTTMALHIIAEAQKMGGRAAFVDAEHALDPEYAKRIGVKINDMLISQPDTGEQALDIVESLVKSGAVDIIVVDSVAALVPRAEIEGEMGQSHMGLQARLMSQALRKLTAISSKSNTVIIFINQIRMNIGMVFGNPETTPGGKALKFYASVRIEIKKTNTLKKGEVAIGNRVRAKVVKNKVAAPFRVAEIDIIYNEGISFEADVLNLAIKHEIVKKSGAWIIYEGEKIGQGIDAARIHLKENKQLLNKLVSEVKKAAANEETTEKPEPVAE
jgi:recombination protein RecA